jgi:hypothetical protein
MSDIRSDNIELTDHEWRELLALLFSGAKRTPEQTERAIERLRSALQMRPRLAPPQPRRVQTPGEIKKSG